MRDMQIKLWMVAATTISFAASQTQVDLRTQSKSVDFSAAQSTKAFQAGASLQAVTTAPSGQNSFGCVVANIWAQESAGVPAITITNSGSHVGTEPAVDFSQRRRYSLRHQRHRIEDPGSD